MSEIATLNLVYWQCQCQFWYFYKTVKICMLHVAELLSLH